MSWRGLRWRLLWILVPVLVSLFVFDSWRDSASLKRELDRAYDQSLLEPAQALADSLGWDDQGAIALTAPFHIISMFEAVNGQHKYLRVAMQAPDGSHQRVLMGAASFPPPPSATGPTSGNFMQDADGARRFYNASVNGHPVRIVALLRVVHDRDGQEWRVLIQTAQDTNRVSGVLNDLMWETLWRDARTLIVLIVVVWFGIAWGLRPLQALRRTIRERSSDDLQPLDTSHVPAEVRPLVDAMNEHLAQQREALQAQRQFLADASHQLRTPLAIMTTQAGYALRESDPAAIRSSLLSMRQQLQRSRRVAEQLLALANASQPAQQAAALQYCDANAVAREVVLAHLPLALEKQQDLGFVDARGEDFDADSAPSDSAGFVAPVAASSNVLYELLANVVHNAILYTPSGGRISVLVQLQAKQVQVLVQDNGPGIAVEDRERAFARFERLLTAAQGSQTSGSGLGLAIARTYARRMHGEVVLADGDGGRGLSVHVLLPLAQPVSGKLS